MKGTYILGYPASLLTEDVSGETEISFEVEVSMSVAVDKDGDPERIEALRFPDDFPYVDLHPPPDH